MSAHEHVLVNLLNSWSGGGGEDKIRGFAEHHIEFNKCNNAMQGSIYHMTLK